MAGRRYPCIESPCPRLPANPDNATSVWCSHCATPVHNLAAMDEAQQAELLARPGRICASYPVSRSMLASAAALLLAGPADHVLAQEQASDTETEQLEPFVITGGRIRQTFTYESVFLETEDEPRSEPLNEAKQSDPEPAPRRSADRY